jgi:hypothetical protein
MITDLFNLVWTSDRRFQPHGAKAMSPASSKAGPWMPHNATAIAQSQFWLSIDKLFAAVLTERLNKIHTRTQTPVSVQERAQHSIRSWPSQLEKQRQRDGLHAHVLPRHAKGIRQGLACWSVLKLHKVASQANRGASSMIIRKLS